MNQYPDYGRQTPPPMPEYNHMTVAEQTNSVMKRVYVRMFIGLLVTAFVSLGIASSQAAMMFFFGNKFLFWGMPIAMIAMAIMLPSRMYKMSPSAVLTCFIIFAALMGAWMAQIFLVYRLGNIAMTFFICSGTFGAMSVYGYFTKSDLTRLGSYLMMALFGLIILMIVNIFMQSSALEWIVSIIGVVLFIGLTAYDTQQVKRLSAANLDPALTDKLATMGALTLYLDFINLFLFLLRIFGGNRN